LKHNTQQNQDEDDTFLAPEHTTTYKSGSHPSFRLQVSTFDAQLFDGQVTYVDVPGLDGRVGVLWHHTPLLTLLVKGQVTLHPVGESPRSILVMGGIVEIGPWGVIILADPAVHDDAAAQQRINAARQKTVERHKKMIAQGVLPGSAEKRALVLDNELNLFMFHAMRVLQKKKF
jgi:F-type H+-transporting ATPase subunit epsilon